MALTNGPNTGLLVNGALGELHYLDLMKQWRWLDFFLNPRVISKSLLAPPASPANGDAYIVAAGTPTGAWAGQANKIARWTSDITTPAWEFITPKQGFSPTYNIADSKTYQYNGTTWAEGGGGGAGATGGGTDQVFFLNDKVVTTSFTIPSGKNAISGGPIQINDGVVVTVSDGSTWTVT